ncbi:NUDIX hydrolase, partial [Streptomyces sp. NPDC000963]
VLEDARHGGDLARFGEALAEEEGLDEVGGADAGLGDVPALLRHPDSAYAGRTWHALAGHLEAEAATAGLAREAYEEAGLVIDPADLELVHTVHTVDRPGARPRIQLFFRPRRWEGTPEVREPDRCLGWEWFSVEDLPEPIVPYTRVAIEGIRTGRPYSELGWSG